MDTKISALTTKGTPTTSDLVPIVDVSDTSNKKMTIGALQSIPFTWTEVQKFDKASATISPSATSSGSVSFVADAGGFLAVGTSYQYYIYSYYFDGLSYAYDSFGYFTSGTDPNDASNYNIKIDWSVAGDANGYFILDFMTSQYVDVGNVLTYTITPSTSWTAGSPPSSPTSLTTDGGGAWFQSPVDYTATDFTAFKLGAGPSYYLRAAWIAAGAGGNGCLRLEDSSGSVGSGTLQYINANLYGVNINISNQLLCGNVVTTNISTTNLTVSGLTTGQVLYNSSGVVTGDGGFEYNGTTNRLLIASASLTPQSKLHIDSGTSTSSDIRFTAGTTTGQTSSDGFQVGITSTGEAEIRQREAAAISVYTNNTLVGTWSSAGNLTLNPTGGGGLNTNRTLSFGNGYGNVAIYMYDSGGTTRYGWGMKAGNMQFFQATASGNTFTWNYGGDFNSTGVNELMRLQQYNSGTGAGLSMGNTAFAPTTPYRIDLQGVSATTASAGVEDIVRFSRIQTGGVSYPEAFTIGLGRYSSSGLGPDTRVDFKLKSTAATNFTADATVLTLQSNLVVQTYGALCVTSQQSAGLLTALPLASFAINYTGSSTLGTFIIGEDKRASGSSGGAFVALGCNDGAAAASGDRLGGFLFFSYDGTSQTRNGAGVFAFADGTWSSTSIPTYLTFEVAPSGSATRAESFRVTSSGDVQLADAKNITFNTTTGSKLGTATTQKIGFWNATPIVQPTTSVAASTFAANTSAIANDTATFDGYTIGQVVKALRNLGILA